MMTRLREDDGDWLDEDQPAQKRIKQNAADKPKRKYTKSGLPRKKPEPSAARTLKKKHKVKKPRIFHPPDPDKLEACGECPHIARCLRTLQEHMFNEHNHGSLCLECGAHSQTFKLYEKHMETHLLPCDQCDYKAIGLKRMRLHKKAHKPASTKPKVMVQCDMCGKEVMESSLKEHMQNYHSNTLYTCDWCGFTTHSKGNLRLHRKRHLETVQECPVCFKKVKNLSLHIRRNKCGQKDREKYPCTECDKVFALKWQLKRHVNNIHNQIKNYLCDLCDYRTYSSFNLRIHKSKMHTKQSIEVVCSVCHKKTYGIDNHMKTYHFEVLLEQQQRCEAETAESAEVQQ